MKPYGIFILAAMFIGIYGCNQSSKSQSIDPSGAIANSTSERANSGHEIVACQHASKIYWTGSKPGGRHSGIIRISSGNYIVDGDKLVGGSFLIDMNSIVDIDLDDQAMNNKLISHLKSEDFFYVDSFPESKFIIETVAKLKNENFSHLISGYLTIKSITQPITFRANVKVHNGAVSATSEEFAINRVLWGINYKSKSVVSTLKDAFIDDDIQIKIDAFSM